MDMDSDDSLSDLSELSDFRDLTDLTERLWDITDEEDADCDAESPPVVQAGRRLWRHAEDRHGKYSMQIGTGGVWAWLLLLSHYPAAAATAPGGSSSMAWRPQLLVVVA